MSGKIFAESRDIYQDQAKVVFEYYRAAAEKIVAEELLVEKQIQEKEQLKASGDELLKKSSLNFVLSLVALGVAALVTVVGLVYENFLPVLLLAGAIAYVIYAFSAKKKAETDIANVDRALEDLRRKHQSIFRDYKIEKLGVAYVPVAGRIPFEDKSFVVDYTGREAMTDFELQKVNNQQLLHEKVDELNRLVSEAPIVESSDEVTEVDTDNYSRSIQKVKYYDYFSTVDRTLRVLGGCLQDISTTSVQLPVVHPSSQLARELEEYATTHTGQAPVLSVFNTRRFDEEIEKFNELSNTRLALATDSRQFEQVLRDLIRKVAASVQVISRLKVASANKLVEDSNKLLFKMLKASYNHYSAELEADEISKMRAEDFNYSEAVERYTPFRLKPSSRVRYNVISDCWEAEDGSKTTAPFVISQIQEEIVAPIVQNLLMESRVERLRIYNNIKDQKINYLNQWHQDTENFYGRNRTTSDDLKNLMRANLTKFLAAQTTLSSLEGMKASMAKKRQDDEQLPKETSSAEMLAAYELQTKEFEKVQNDFEEYMNRLKDDIDERARDFAYIEYYDGSLRDKMAKEIVTASDSADALEARRRPLLAVNPLYAKVSEMPPQPDVEPIVDEHMSINLNVIAERSLAELDEQERQLAEETRE